VAVDLTAQGLAFFAGRATLRQTVALPPLDGRTLLELHNLHAAVAHVRVNGRQAGTVAWQPHAPGDGVEQVGQLRPLDGPEVAEAHPLDERASLLDGTQPPLRDTAVIELTLA